MNNLWSIKESLSAGKHPKIENEGELKFEITEVLGNYWHIFCNSLDYDSNICTFYTVQHNRDALRYLISLFREDYEKKGLPIAYALRQNDEFRFSLSVYNLELFLSLSLIIGESNDDVVYLLRKVCEHSRWGIVSILMESGALENHQGARYYFLDNLDVLTAKDRHQFIKKYHKSHGFAKLARACYDSEGSRLFYLITIFVIFAASVFLDNIVPYGILFSLTGLLFVKKVLGK